MTRSTFLLMALPFVRVALALAAALSLCPAQAATVLDTGTPNGNAIGSYAFDATDSYAAAFSLLGPASITGVAVHVLRGTSGETFTISVFDDAGLGGTPGSALFSTVAVFTGDGWNGANSLGGWDLAAGRYWLAASVGIDDTLGTDSLTLLDREAPAPAAATAFSSGGPWAQTAAPLSIGVRLDAVSAVPEPSTVALLLSGFASLAGVAHLRRTGRL